MPTSPEPEVSQADGSRPPVQRVWRWLWPALLGALALNGASSYGLHVLSGKWFAWHLVAPAAVLGVLVGLSAAAARRVRHWLGAGTAWVALMTTWGLTGFLLARIPAQCWVEDVGGRCSTQQSAVWGVNAALVVVLMMLVLEPPRLARRVFLLVREWRRERRERSWVHAPAPPPSREKPGRNPGRTNRPVAGRGKRRP